MPAALFCSRRHSLTLWTVRDYRMMESVFDIIKTEFFIGNFESAEKLRVIYSVYLSFASVTSCKFLLQKKLILWTDRMKKFLHCCTYSKRYYTILAIWCFKYEWNQVRIKEYPKGKKVVALQSSIEVNSSTCSHL